MPKLNVVKITQYSGQFKGNMETGKRSGGLGVPRGQRPTPTSFRSNGKAPGGKKGRMGMRTGTR